MTKVTFLKRGGAYYGFHETGHTGWGESGDDVLCAALSAMTMLIINVIEVSYGSSVEYTIDEKTTDITVKAYGAVNDPDDRKRFAISGLIEGYFLQLSDMLEDYYDYLDVEEISEDANVQSDSLGRK
jgi:uncharacterized protein YsxB (DUF464 family)